MSYLRNLSQDSKANTERQVKTQLANSKKAEQAALEALKQGKKKAKR